MSAFQLVPRRHSGVTCSNGCGRAGSQRLYLAGYPVPDGRIASSEVTVCLCIKCAKEAEAIWGAAA